MNKIYITLSEKERFVIEKSKGNINLTIEYVCVPYGMVNAPPCTGCTDCKEGWKEDFFGGMGLPENKISEIISALKAVKLLG